MHSVVLVSSQCVSHLQLLFFFFFFFQAEDGIRDLTVTGVQTCALPIYPASALHTKNSPLGRAMHPAAAPFASVRQSDRKSTRLNSSHSQISYAVFCLKKKKHITTSIKRLTSSIYTPQPSIS